MEGLGWVSLHRKILVSEIWNSNEPYTKRDAWIYLLLVANHKSKSIVSGNKIIEIKRGEILTSEHKLCAIFKWGRTKLRNYLGLLKQLNQVSLKRTTKYTIISIESYDSYQMQGTTNEQQKNIKQTTRKHQKNINNNDNNENNVNNKEKITKKEIKVEHELQLFVIKNFSDIIKIKEQLTNEQCIQLIKDYGRELVISKLEALDNQFGKLKSGILPKTVYRTINKWCQNEKKWNQNQNKLDEVQETLPPDTSDPEIKKLFEKQYHR